MTACYCASVFAGLSYGVPIRRRDVHALLSTVCERRAVGVGWGNANRIAPPAAVGHEHLRPAARADQRPQLLRRRHLWHHALFRLDVAFPHGLHEHPAVALLAAPWVGFTPRLAKWHRIALVLEYTLSWFLLFHHFAIGAFKLAKSHQPPIFAGDSPLVAETLLLSVYGGGLSHLSFSMSAVGVPGAPVVRGLSIILRVGGDLASLSLAESLMLRILFGSDLIWLTCVIVISLVLRFVAKDTPNSEEPNLPSSSADSCACSASPSVSTYVAPAGAPGVQVREESREESSFAARRAIMSSTGVSFKQVSIDVPQPESERPASSCSHASLQSRSNVDSSLRVRASPSTTKREMRRQMLNIMVMQALTADA